jgi:dihydrofolate reductase
VSLDGYIADKDGGVGWLEPYSSAEIDFAGFMKTIGVTVVGRVTFDWAVSQGQGGKFCERTVLLTHRPLRNPSPGVEVLGGDVRVLASQLRRDLAGTGKDIWLIGGGKSIATFHAEGLVDSWELSVIPVLLGDGIPLFPKHTRGAERLRLQHSRTLKNGMVEVCYEPERVVI